MANIKITQVKSTIDRSKRQKATIKALGITKLNGSVVKEA
ncbi:MAG: 50S ribosomal protein L30, partial [Saprospiraceae bacterium]|nr:50S ribosomal protein L30 [Saprospiraceae bacterium]